VTDLISVIIPAFNAAEYLTQAIASVRAQRGIPLEILVIDDGSTDATPYVAQQVAGIRYLRQDNSGPAAARNKGIAASQGSLLAFLDADDLWVAGKLTAQLSALETHPDVHLVAGHVAEFMTDAGAATEKAPHRSHYGQRAYTVGTLLIRRTDFRKVGWFEPQLRFGEFMEWLSRAKGQGLRELVLDQVVLHRRIHAANTTRLAKDHQRHYLAAIRKHLERQRGTSSDAAGSQGEST